MRHHYNNFNMSQYSEPMPIQFIIASPKGARVKLSEKDLELRQKNAVAILDCEKLGHEGGMLDLLQ